MYRAFHGFWQAKFTSVVNFINFKCTNFLYKRRVSAAFSSYMYVEKQCSYEKFVHKMLMKLTHGGSITGLKQFTLLPQLPPKAMLYFKVVKIDAKIIISLH